MNVPAALMAAGFPFAFKWPKGETIRELPANRRYV